MTIKLIVGLGNPGTEYAKTRHNIGFMWVEALAEQHRVTFKTEAKYKAKMAKIHVGQQEVALMMPQTFMNKSGEAVAPYAHFFKIPPEEILVIHDELDLPLGTNKLKQAGGNGGHNGLKDIQARLGSANFWRLRLGIGHPGDRDKVVAYVLNAFRKEEIPEMEIALRETFDHLDLILSGQMQAAMMKLHTKK